MKPVNDFIIQFWDRWDIRVNPLKALVDW